MLETLYLALVIALSFVPGAYAFVKAPRTDLKVRSAMWGGSALLSITVALAVSYELAIVLAIAMIAGVYFAHSREVIANIDVIGELTYELKEDWAYFPKKKNDRIALEKEAAELIQREEGKFHATQVYSLLRKTYGIQAGNKEIFLKKEIGGWMKSDKEVKFVDKGKGRTQYYKFKENGGEKK